jgi:hypothetical protein
MKFRPILLHTVFIWLALSIGYTASAQIHHNYLMEEYLSFREDHNWLAAHRMGAIYELKTTFPEEDQTLTEVKLDHNGLPVTLRRSEGGFSWESPEVIETDETILIQYVVDNFFLRQEKTGISTVRSPADTHFTNVRYVNFFNRTSYESADGFELNYHYDNNRLKSIEARNSEGLVEEIELEYGEKKVRSVTQIKSRNGSENKEVRTVNYEYDDHQRPHRAKIRSGESEISVQIQYDRSNKPVEIRFYVGDELVEKREYKYQKRPEISIPGMD